MSIKCSCTLKVVNFKAQPWSLNFPYRARSANLAHHRTRREIRGRPKASEDGRRRPNVDAAQPRGPARPQSAGVTRRGRVDLRRSRSPARNVAYWTLIFATSRVSHTALWSVSWKCIVLDRATSWETIAYSDTSRRQHTHTHTYTCTYVSTMTSQWVSRGPRVKRKFSPSCSTSLLSTW